MSTLYHVVIDVLAVLVLTAWSAILALHGQQKALKQENKQLSNRITMLERRRQ